MSTAEYIDLHAAWYRSRTEDYNRRIADSVRMRDTCVRKGELSQAWIWETRRRDVERNFASLVVERLLENK